jgi:hypothetical protein
MKWGKLTAERCRVYTLEITDVDHEMVRQTDRGTYIYSEFAARKALMENQFFQWDCAAFDFPYQVRLYESDTPDTFDIEVFWRKES